MKIGTQLDTYNNEKIIVPSSLIKEVFDTSPSDFLQEYTFDDAEYLKQETIRKGSLLATVKLYAEGFMQYTYSFGSPEFGTFLTLLEDTETGSIGISTLPHLSPKKIKNELLQMAYYHHREDRPVKLQVHDMWELKTAWKAGFKTFDNKPYTLKSLIELFNKQKDLCITTGVY